MNRPQWTTGDLVYIPSKTSLVSLTQTAETGMQSVETFKELAVPATVLVTGYSTRHDMYEVVFQGAKWLVGTKDTYPAPEINKIKEQHDGSTNCQVR